MRGETVLLRVVHGSRLYGTATEQSDWDWFEVTDTPEPGNPWTERYGSSGQDLEGRSDTVRKDLGRFLREVAAGVPQACEAAWARPEFAEVDEIRELRLSLRVEGWARHRRAMRNFASAYWEGGPRGRGYAEKRATHAVRIALNLATLGERGWYDPTLPEGGAGFCRTVAANLGPGDELLATCDWIALGDTMDERTGEL